MRLFIAALFAGGLAAAALAATTPRSDSIQLAVVYPPWWSAARSASAAASSGDIAAVGRWGVLVVRSRRPGLQARLRATGALWIMDGSAAAVCADQALGGAAHVL